MKVPRSTVKVKQKWNTRGFNSTHLYTDADRCSWAEGVSVTDRAAGNKNVTGISQWLNNEIFSLNRGDHWQHFKQHFIGTEREGGKERERVDQKAEKTTSINVEPSTQTKSQLKQRQMDNFHFCSGTVTPTAAAQTRKLQAEGDRGWGTGACRKKGSVCDRWMWQRLISATERRGPA